MELTYIKETDLLRIDFDTDKVYDVEEEICPGFHVLYEWDTATHKRTNKIVAIEIEYFKERFNSIFYS